MKKLVLNIEQLEVASFETAQAAEERGTVVAHTGYWFCFGTLVCSTACPDPT